MAYCFSYGESIQEDIRRIVSEQIGKAISDLSGSDLQEGIHTARQRCKKIRAVLQLIRPELGSAYRDENARFRDAARSVASLRDADVLIETYDHLMDHFSADRSSFATVRRNLVSRRNRIARSKSGLDARVSQFADFLKEARDRASGWRLRHEGFDAIRTGLGNTYRRGAKAMKAAYLEQTDEIFHAWRKQAKYHLYHLSLLRNLWQPVFERFHAEFAKLAAHLGDDHDLVVLRQVLLEKPEDFGRQFDLPALLALIDRRRAELQAAADILGVLAFSEKPKALVRRIGGYWREAARRAALQR